MTPQNLGYTLLVLLPIVLSLTVLLRNINPYDATAHIETSANNQFDLAQNELNLLPSKYLSPKYIDSFSRVYRSLSGPGTISFSPRRSVINSEITLNLKSDNLIVIPEEVAIDSPALTYETYFDFSDALPSELLGDAYQYDNFAYFDGNTSLSMPNTKDSYESGPMTIYIRWSPQDVSHSMQQIVGHFNWEIWQNSNSVEFRVGRLDGLDGEVVSVSLPVSDSFFGNTHEAYAVYSPGEHGYIELIVDGHHAGRQYIGAGTIFSDYGQSDLTMGWTQHNFGKSPHYIGNIYEVGISSSVLDYSKSIRVLDKGEYEYRWHLIPVSEDNQFRGASISITSI